MIRLVANTLTPGPAGSESIRNDLTTMSIEHLVAGGLVDFRQISFVAIAFLRGQTALPSLPKRPIGH